MLTTLNLKVGSILHDMEQNIDHRVIYMNKDYFVTILINGIKEKTEINEWHIQTLQHFVNKKQIAVREPKFDKVFDFDSLPEKTKEIYLRNKDIVETVGDIYGPCYFCLGTRKPKPCFQELADKYNISKKTVFYVIKQYLTNGLDPFALLPQIGKKSKANMHYSTKTGRPPMFEQGIPLTDELREIFDDCCKHYLSGREKSYATTYDWMLTKYFTARVETQTSDGVVVQNKLLPIDQRPTKSQMENYIVTHTSAKARRVCKTSKREYRNDERMLVSDNLLNVHGPGDLFEMDEVEMDVSIVSEVDPTKVIGRPIVHAMVDVYGSEYRSKEVKRICNELNITLELVPPAMGSLKGQVEQLFHQYHSVQNDLLEGKGLITKRYDSNHHRHAVLTLDDIWVFVINQTIAHNMMTMSQYPMTKDMLEKSAHPIPLELWDYGCTKYGAPRPIVNLDQFEYSIRKEVRARITRKGIEWNGLYYIANDPWLAEQITKTRRSSVPLKCRLDERNIGSLWYIADNRLVKATLNENRAGNYEFNGMSLRNYEEYKTKKKELVMEKAQEDQEICCARRMGMQATLDDAVRVANHTAPNDDKTKNIRHNRKEESILVLEANSIGAHLNTDDAPSLIPLKNEEPEPEALSEPESNEETGSMTFEEALQKIKQKM